MTINALHDFAISNSLVNSFTQLNDLQALFNAKSVRNANEICLKGALDLLQYVNWLQHFVHLSCLASKRLADVCVQFGFTDRPVLPGVGANVDVQHIEIPKGLLIDKEPPGVMDVPAQMDLIPPEEVMGQNIHELEARIVGRVVTNGADVASDLRS